MCIGHKGVEFGRVSCADGTPRYDVEVHVVGVAVGYGICRVSWAFA